jgi:hypothetical protein
MIAWFNDIRFYDTPGVSQRTWPNFPRDITVNKDDFGFVGTHEVLIQVFFRYMKKWQLIDIAFDLIIPNPCDEPTCVADEEENCGNPGKAETVKDYYYTGDSPSLTLWSKKYLDPQQCKIYREFTCEVLSGPRSDICEILAGSEGDTEASLDQTSGKFTLSATDVSSVPPGKYVIAISQKVGSKSFTTEYTVHLKNPCTDLPPTFLKNSPLEDMIYTSRTPAEITTWKIDDVAVPSTDLNCGDVAISFEMKNGDPLDTTIFTDDRTGATNKFKVGPTVDETMVGEYDIKVIASYEDYPANKAEWRHLWEIDIVNPCNNPVSITPSLVGPQTYILTDEAKEVKFDRFTTDPDWCEVTYTYTTSGASDAIVLNTNMASRTFSFFYDTDLRLAKGSKQDYTINIIGKIGKRTTKTAKTSFSLTLKDPCIKNNFVTINAPVLT